MNLEVIRIWRDSRHMGAILGSNMAEGEAEFQEIDVPYGRFQQFLAGIVAACRLQDRLGIVGPIPVVWVSGDQTHVFDPLESNNAGEEEEDSADWWKS